MLPRTDQPNDPWSSGQPRRDRNMLLIHLLKTVLPSSGWIIKYPPVDLGSTSALPSEGRVKPSPGSSVEENVDLDEIDVPLLMHMMSNPPPSGPKILDLSKLRRGYSSQFSTHQSREENIFVDAWQHYENFTAPATVSTSGVEGNDGKSRLSVVAPPPPTPAIGNTTDGRSKEASSSTVAGQPDRATTTTTTTSTGTATPPPVQVVNSLDELFAGNSVSGATVSTSSTSAATAQKPSLAAITGIQKREYVDPFAAQLSPSPQDKKVGTTKPRPQTGTASTHDVAPDVELIDESYELVTQTAPLEGDEKSIAPRTDTLNKKREPFAVDEDRPPFEMPRPVVVQVTPFSSNPCWEQLGKNRGLAELRMGTLETALSSCYQTILLTCQLFVHKKPAAFGGVTTSERISGGAGGGGGGGGGSPLLSNTELRGHVITEVLNIIRPALGISTTQHSEMMNYLALPGTEHLVSTSAQPKKVLEVMGLPPTSSIDLSTITPSPYYLNCAVKNPKNRSNNSNNEKHIAASTFALNFATDLTSSSAPLPLSYRGLVIAAILSTTYHHDESQLVDPEEIENVLQHVSTALKVSDRVVSYARVHGVLLKGLAIEREKYLDGEISVSELNRKAGEVGHGSSGEPGFAASASRRGGSIPSSISLRQSATTNNSSHSFGDGRSDPAKSESDQQQYNYFPHLLEGEDAINFTATLSAAVNDMCSEEEEMKAASGGPTGLLDRIEALQYRNFVLQQVFEYVVPKLTNYLECEDSDLFGAYCELYVEASKQCTIGFLQKALCASTKLDVSGATQPQQISFFLVSHMLCAPMYDEFSQCIEPLKAQKDEIPLNEMLKLVTELWESVEPFARIWSQVVPNCVGLVVPGIIRLYAAVLWIFWGGRRNDQASFAADGDFDQTMATFKPVLTQLIEPHLGNDYVMSNIYAGMEDMNWIKDSLVSKRLEAIERELDGLLEAIFINTCWYNAKLGQGPDGSSFDIFAMFYQLFSPVPDWFVPQAVTVVRHFIEISLATLEQYILRVLGPFNLQPKIKSIGQELADHVGGYIRVKVINIELANRISPMFTSVALSEVLLRFNTIVATRENLYKYFEKMYKKNDDGVSKYTGGDSPLNTVDLQKKYKVVIDRCIGDLLDFMAMRIVYHDLGDILRERLYKLDYKYYKANKGNEKLFREHGGNIFAHLTFEEPNLNVGKVLSGLDEVLLEYLPNITAVGMRERLVLQVFFHFLIAYFQVVLDGGDMRFFYPAQSEFLFQELCFVESFFLGALSDYTKKNFANKGPAFEFLASFKCVITMIMPISSEELVNGSEVSPSYKELPETFVTDTKTGGVGAGGGTAGNVFNQWVVKKILAHRKDRPAKNFTASLD